VTAHADDAAAAAGLLRAASAVLGEERAAQLRDALAERAAQLTRVGQAAAAVPQRQPPAAPASPGAASMAAWERRRDQTEALEGRLRAWAWQAPLAGGPGSGGAAGALDGYVAGVKDVIDVAGMPTRAGSPLTSPAPARADAPAVARLRAAGAAIAGKTHCTEWALNDPAPTRNPWAPDRTPGLRLEVLLPASERMSVQAAARRGGTSARPRRRADSSRAGGGQRDHGPQVLV
jgi:Asp-tRNA(Asn)/Glu-tRNA(Gln) amidotransferase A subunit family amidase